MTTEPKQRSKIREIRIIIVVSDGSTEARGAELDGLEKETSIEGVSRNAGGRLVWIDGTAVVVELYNEAARALEALRRGPTDLVIIDNREDDSQDGFSSTIAGRLLPELLAFDNPSRFPSRSAILVVLPNASYTPHHAFTAGALQLGGVMVDPPSLRAILESAVRLVAPVAPRKVALCLAGGGIEGMIYEMGALRALDAHLKGRGVADFDIFSGISAGAIIGAFLANGIEPSEMSDSIHGKPSRVSPITRSLLFDPDLSEMTSRVVDSAGDLLKGHWLRKPVEAAMKITPSAIFSGEKMKWHLEKELTKPGMTNDFARLQKELFIGASDQDSGKHVTFGVEGLSDIPISHALRASAAMTPYYPPEKIKDRYYIDGIFTRTINLDIAVARGATLIVCVDPLTPVQTEAAGYVSGRGGFFNTVQSVKSFVRSRLFEVLDRAEEAYPNVNVCVFSPTRQDLETMSVTMMRFMRRGEIEEMAYQSVSRRIENEFEWLVGDFERHGFELTKKPS